MHRVTSPGWQFVRHIFVAEANPHGLAWGMALGLLFGLLPKLNLTALVVFGIMFAPRVNLVAGIVTGLSVSFFSYHLDSVFHAVGQAWLTVSVLQPFFRRLFALPIIPWMHWNNTVVAGALMVGLALLWPVQRCLQRLFAAQLPRMRSRATEKIVLHPVSQ